MEITKEILSRSAQQVHDILIGHKDSINLAFEAGEEILEIPVKIRYSFIDSKLKIFTSVNFVKSRVKDNTVAWYDPKQKTLFDDEEG